MKDFGKIKKNGSRAFEVTDQPNRETSHDPDSHFWNIASSIDVEKVDLTKERKK